MTTLEELKQMRPVDSHELQRLVNEMHAEARVFQLQELRKDLGLTQTDLAKKEFLRWKKGISRALVSKPCTNTSQR